MLCAVAIAGADNPDFNSKEMLLLCRFEFQRKYELYFESSKVGSADSGPLLYQPVSGNMRQNLSKTHKKPSPSFGTTLRQLFFFKVEDGDFFSMRNIKLVLIQRFPQLNVVFNHLPVGRQICIQKLSPGVVFAHLSRPWSSGWVALSFLLFVCLFIPPW